MFEPALQLWPLAAIASYILIQRTLRYKRSRDLQRRFGLPGRPLSSMTDKEAQEIQSTLSRLEFPAAFLKSLEFALFRTYGIPTISKTLVKTKQLTTSSFSPKRYVDTSVLLYEIFDREPGHDRVKQAFSRLNYLHGVYRKSGAILDDDMLYTLSLFAWEPIKWINRIEWRQLTELETCAIGTFIKSMGDAMDISYDVLPSFKEGWVDGNHWLRELGEWAEDYERRCMLPHKDNHQTAEQTTAIFMRTLPASLRGIGKNLVVAVMDDRLRKAMIYEPVSRPYHVALQAFLSVRKNLLRYLALPRPAFLRVESTSNEATKDGRYFLVSYEAFPFYIQPTFARRWGLKGWLKWAIGIPLPGDDGDKYRPQGYKIDECGPDSLVGKGATDMKATRERLDRERTGGCPFSVLKA